MRKEEAVRDYNISDAELIQTVDSVVSSSRRDLADIQDFGITETSLADIETKRDAFSDMATDEELSGIMVSVTEDKNTCAGELRKTIRVIMARVDNKFGMKSGQHRRFGVEGLSRLNDAELYKCGKRVRRQGQALLSQLASEGLTEMHLTDLTTKTASLDEAIDAQDDAIRGRDIAVEERVAMGNDLYADLLKLSNTGKAVYEDSHEAKYNDYVIMKGRSGSGSDEEKETGGE